MKINIQKKIKVVDSVFFNGEIDYLTFRFMELYDTVDIFIVLEFISETNSIFEENLEKFELWKDKIIHVKSKTLSEVDVNKILKFYGFKEVENGNHENIDKVKLSQIFDLKQCLDSLSLNFEDIILISKIDEFPELPSMEILQSHLSFEPVVFHQKEFLWSKNFIKSENHFGTFCFQYSHFILNTNIISLFKESTSRNFAYNFSVINSGYKFSLFEAVEKSIEIIMSKYKHENYEKIKEVVLDSRNNLVYYNLESLSNPKPLIKYYGELPKNIGILNSQEIGRDIPKKHIVVIGLDASFDLNVDAYDSTTIVTQTDKLSTNYHNVVSNTVNLYYILKPNKKYYDVLIDDNTLENFQKMYFFNEIKKILFSLNPLDFDIFEFKIGGKLLTFSWVDIKDKFIYDTISY